MIFLTIIPSFYLGLSGSVDVDLSGNQLTELDESVFKALLDETSGNIDISSNPLVCGCDIYWLIDISGILYFSYTVYFWH